MPTCLPGGVSSNPDSQPVRGSIEGYMRREIRWWMEENNILLSHLAYRSAGLSVGTIRRWLNGGKVSQDTHDKILGGLRGVGCPREIRRRVER